MESPLRRPSSPEEAESPFKGRRGLHRLAHALGYSLSGLAAAYRHEAAFRQECWLAVVLVPIALGLPVVAVAKALMVGSLLLVLIAELLNSAIEAAVDRVSLAQHRLAKRAKDIGSAAVLLALINVLIVWSVILIDRFR